LRFLYSVALIFTLAAFSLGINALVQPWYETNYVEPYATFDSPTYLTTYYGEYYKLYTDPNNVMSSVVQYSQQGPTFQSLRQTMLVTEVFSFVGVVTSVVAITVIILALIRPKRFVIATVSLSLTPFSAFLIASLTLLNIPKGIVDASMCSTNGLPSGNCNTFSGWDQDTLWKWGPSAGWICSLSGAGCSFVSFVLCAVARKVFNKSSAKTSPTTTASKDHSCTNCKSSSVNQPLLHIQVPSYVGSPASIPAFVTTPQNPFPPGMVAYQFPIH